MSNYQYTPGPRMGEPEFPSMIKTHGLGTMKSSIKTSHGMLPRSAMFMTNPYFKN